MKIRCHSNNYTRLGHERVQCLFFFPPSSPSPVANNSPRYESLYNRFWPFYVDFTSMAREPSLPFAKFLWYHARVTLHLTMQRLNIIVTCTCRPIIYDYRYCSSGLFGHYIAGRIDAILPQRAARSWNVKLRGRRKINISIFKKRDPLRSLRICIAFYSYSILIFHAHT